MSELLIRSGGTWRVLSGGTPTTTAPAAPSGVLAVPGDGEVTISWDAPDDGGATITGYTVVVDGVTEHESASTSHTVTELVNGQSYSFTVYATNAVGDGPESSAVQATPIGDVAEWESLFVARDVEGLDAWYVTNTGHITDPSEMLAFPTSNLIIDSTWLTNNEDDDHVSFANGRWRVERVHARSFRIAVNDITFYDCFADGQGGALNSFAQYQTARSGVLIERCTLDGGGVTNGSAISFGGASSPNQIVIRQCNIHSHRTGLYIIGGVYAEYNYVHDLVYSVGSHNTSGSIRAGNVTLYRNRLTDGNSSSLSMYAENSPYSGLLVQENIISTPIAIYEINFPNDKAYYEPQPGETRRLIDNLLERGTASHIDNWTEVSGNVTYDGTALWS